MSARMRRLCRACASILLVGSACSGTVRKFGRSNGAGGTGGAVSVNAAAGDGNSADDGGDSGASSGGAAGSDGGTQDPAGIGGGVSGAGGSCGSGGSAIAGAAGGDAVAGGAGASASTCGNGKLDAGEDCDQGAANSSTAYGVGLCTNQCKVAPYCGDKIRNGSEACDGGATGSTTLGDCNPECTGFYEKRVIAPTLDNYSTNLGGIAGADAKCAIQFGADYKALVVGATRRATVTPLKGDQPLDWVIEKYRYYYNNLNELLWRTDEVPLLAVRDGKRQDIYANAFAPGGAYPWSGYALDWTTYDDAVSATTYAGTCDSWTSDTTGWGSFVGADLRPGSSELCGARAFILCVEQ
ncbi:MAG: DUF1554 domain-containing protein [Polyangiaceae bacterium]